MQSMFAGLVCLSVFVYGSFAQDFGKVPHPRIELLPTKLQPTTAPKLIDESAHKKECPAGFQFVGKQCAKTLTAPVDILCPTGTIQIDGRCVKYVGKDKECPHGFIEWNDQCVRREVAEVQPSCPIGFELIGNDKCLKKLPLPEVKECPTGSIPKGDSCVKSIFEAPEYVCPTGFILIGKKCQRETTFDCTPPRKPTAAPVNESKKGDLHLRVPAHGKGKEATVYHLPATTPIVEEYVILETCKRIITEAAHAICPDGGSFNGKTCEKDIFVPEIIRPGGFRDLIIPANLACPEGFLESDSKADCLATEFAPPELFCPIGTIDLGDKCAIYSSPRTACPEGFYLEGKICAKTVFAAPLVEYTLTYACTGKDCGHHHIGK